MIIVNLVVDNGWGVGRALAAPANHWVPVGRSGAVLEPQVRVAPTQVMHLARLPVWGSSQPKGRYLRDGDFTAAHLGEQGGGEVLVDGGFLCFHSSSGKCCKSFKSLYLPLAFLFSRKSLSDK